MREILFRGKKIDNEEWVYGFFVGSSENATYDEIFSPSNGLFKPWKRHTVDFETVGQYTGLTDIMGAKIFEGDIVKFKHGGEFAAGGIYHRNYAVEFVNTYATYGLRLRNKSIFFPLKQSTAYMHDVMVIGNIYDNPDLLRRESDNG